MKNFAHWGIKIKKNLDKNYYSIWEGLSTTRLDCGDILELPAERSEFYDVGIGTKCNAECEFCMPPGTMTICRGINDSMILKPIELVTAGNEVLSFNENTREQEWKPVDQVFVRDYYGDMITILTGNNRTIDLTPNHKVYLRKPTGEVDSDPEANWEWIEAGNLPTERKPWLLKRAGSRIDTRVMFAGTSRRLYSGPVFNIGVRDNNNYYANNILVHNCYVSAGRGGEAWPDICGTWKRWMSTIPMPQVITSRDVNTDPYLNELLSPILDNEGDQVKALKIIIQTARGYGYPITYSERPFQISIGSTGEPTIHPDFCEFLKVVFNSFVVPNYTTNGIILSDINNPRCKEILDATSRFCGGVAVSFGNKAIRDKAIMAIENLLEYGDCSVMIHHIISDKASVDEFVEATMMKFAGGEIRYHVLLPLMEHGRSKKGTDKETFEYLVEQIKIHDITNVAFGANFAPYIQANPDALPFWEYPREVYSKNILLKGGDVGIEITPSSFNLSPIKTIKL